MSVNGEIRADEKDKAESLLKQLQNDAAGQPNNTSYVKVTAKPIQVNKAAGRTAGGEDKDSGRVTLQSLGFNPETNAMEPMAMVKGKPVFAKKDADGNVIQAPHFMTLEEAKKNTDAYHDWARTYLNSGPPQPSLTATQALKNTAAYLRTPEAMRDTALSGG